MTTSTRQGDAPKPPLARLIPWWKKLLFAVATTLLFFVLLEVVLAVAGVAPVVVSRDPYVGFSASIPLFVEQQSESGGPLMATAPGKLAYFNHQQFAREKPPGTRRVFCLGGSTTYGRPYDDTTSFPGWLRELLPAAAPGERWEVINAGGISYASYRVAALMQELAAYQPDLFVVYTGHNEFLEKRTYGELQATSPALLRLAGIVGNTRTFAAASALLDRRSTESDGRNLLPGEVKTRLDAAVGPTDYERDDALREKILTHFEVNLGRMVDIADHCGAEIVFVVPASNLKDCSPFKSQHNDKLTANDRGRWRQFFERGRASAEQGDFDEALNLYAEAEKIDGRFAELHYRTGAALLESQRLAEAHDAFRRAVDEDICPLRAVSEIPEIVRKVARARSVPLVDFEARLAAECLRSHGHNSPGAEYFLDHVHFTIAANRLLAIDIAETLRESKILPGEASWSQADVDQITQTVEGRIDRRAHAIADRNLAQVLNWAGKHYEAGPPALRALETLPDDPETLFLSAAYLRMTGRLDEAITNYRRGLRSAPDYVEAHQRLGAALVERGDLEEARGHFLEVIRLSPDDADAYQMVGAIFAEQRKFAESLSYYERALARAQGDANLHYNYAFALEQRGRMSDAAKHYRRALALDPQDAEAQAGLNRVIQSQP